MQYIVDEGTYHKLAFVDEQEMIHFAEYKGLFNHIDDGDVVKLRSISM